MRKFDPIDIFFIAIITTYFITLICIFITLIITNILKIVDRKKKVSSSVLENKISTKENNDRKEIIREKKNFKLSNIPFFKKLFLREIKEDNIFEKLDFYINETQKKGTFTYNELDIDYVKEKTIIDIGEQVKDVNKVVKIKGNNNSNNDIDVKSKSKKVSKTKKNSNKLTGKTKNGKVKKYTKGNNKHKKNNNKKSNSNRKKTSTKKK